MLSRLHLSTILLIAAALWGGMLVFEGVAVNGTWFRPFSTVVGVRETSATPNLDSLDELLKSIRK